MWGERRYKIKGGSPEGHRPLVYLCLWSDGLLFGADSAATGAGRLVVDLSKEPVATIAAMRVGQGGFQDGEEAGDERINV